MMNKLPFLKGSKWPRIGKPVGESKYGFSEDEELMEDTLKELMSAYEAKDHVALIDSLKALVELIRNKESQNAPDSLEAPSGV
jgi:glutamyl-tRNA reductase